MPTTVRFCAEQLSWLKQAGYVEEWTLPDPLSGSGGGRAGRWSVKLRGGETMDLSTRDVRLLLVGLAVGARGRLADQGVPGHDSAVAAAL